MNWKFWARRKRTNKALSKPIEMSLSSLLRWYCYDVGISDVRALMSNFGLIPISEEAEELEMRESNVRLAAVKDLVPFISVYAEISSYVMAEQQRSLIEKTVEDPEHREKLTKMILGNFYALSLQVLVSAFASSVALDLVDKGSKTLWRIDDGEF